MLRISCVPIVLGDFGCDVTCQACWDNWQIRYRTWFQASSGNLDSTNLPGYEAVCSVAVVSTSPFSPIPMGFVPCDARVLASLPDSTLDHEGQQCF